MNHSRWYLLLAVAALALPGCRGAWYEAYGIESEAELRSPDKIPEILKALEDGWCDEATGAIGRMRSKAAEYLPDLMESGAIGDCYQATIRVARRIAPDSPALLKGMLVFGQKERCEALDDLAKSGTKIASMAPELRAMVDGGKCFLEALEALHAATPDSADLLEADLCALQRIDVGTLSTLRSLSSQSSQLDEKYVPVLSKFFVKHGEQVLPGLVKLIGHERWEVRYCAIRMVAHIGKVDSNLVAALERAKSDSEEDVQQAAAEALRKAKFITLSGGKPVVAVLDVGDPAGKLDKSQLEQLTDYLTAQVAEKTGFQVVPRDQIRDKLGSLKRESFKEGFDEAAQLEIGRALAAKKSLTARVIWMKGKCAITAVVMDIEKETSENATTVDTACSIDALTEGMKKLAQNLADKNL
ncbi:MAG: HEAT repeat domain-containing protein [Deltaproteobacteria bacterium]|nr:HEAT repeat domain-containing protein [Deltaproteobacteria bacterium]